MTCRDIQRQLIRDRYSKGFAIPNYTPSGWFECDVFEITKAGFFREYEIKLTVSDFRADEKKRRTDWKITSNGNYERTSSGQKLQMLSECRLRGPSRFYYVAPIGLLTLDHIPEWAGFIEMEYISDSYWPWNHLQRTRREAPQLHRSKVLPEIRAHAESVCYWRFVKLFLDRPETSNTQPAPSPSETEPVVHP